jgi:GNAT superfamily N-acetyltransferase
VNSDQLTVRQAIADDETAILQLLVLMDREDSGSRATLITSSHLRAFVFSAIPRAEAMLAELDGVAVGLAAFHESASTLWCNPEIYIDDLFVVPEVRRIGVGRRLLAAVSRLTRDRSATRILLNVQATNTGAVRFYESLGGVVFPDSRACSLSGPALDALADTSAG